MSYSHFHFPEDYDSNAAIIEAKGWMVGVLVVQTRRYVIHFYCIERLTQDVEEELARGRFFHEKNIVIVRQITKESILSAVEHLVKRDVEDLLAEPVDSDSPSLVNT
jgi:hypothetical protein